VKRSVMVEGCALAGVETLPVGARSSGLSTDLLFDCGSYARRTEAAVEQ
jgi:hypothetical protein